MNRDDLLIVTAQPEFVHTALTELQQFGQECQQLEEFTPGVILCKTSSASLLMQRAAKERPIFARHLAPAQGIIDLGQTEQDIGRIATAIADLPTFALLEKGQRFSVQSRLIQAGSKQNQRPYSGGKLNQALAEAFAEETGAIEAVKRPQVVVSILCTAERAYAGISTPEENLSAWPGGARHFAQTAEQISRAEFKLLEALDVFSLDLPTEGHALDLGAAPGGWTRLLLDAGIAVVAVDPAALDPRVAKRPHLEHRRDYAENYLEQARRKSLRFDLIVNDMRMDARETARLLVGAVPCLQKSGFLISTLKLPHATQNINPLVNFKEAMNILRKRFDLVQARQLFHNRQEVTVVAAYPHLTRR